VISLSEKAIAQHIDYGDRVTSQLLNFNMLVGDWESEMIASIREISIIQYAIGKGGVGRLTQRDYGIIGREMRFQIEKLRAFSGEILSGDLTEAQIRDRARKYFKRTRAMFERGRLEGHRNNGFLWERRRKPAKESCAECVSYFDMGWQMIGTLPGAGEACTCQSNCRCYKEFSSAIVRPNF
jgi:hypothetical protein